jgi:hypothetical protein
MDSSAVFGTLIGQMPSNTPINRNRFITVYDTDAERPPTAAGFPLGQSAYSLDTNELRISDGTAVWPPPIGGSAPVPVPPLLFTVYVAKNGIDATADGSVSKPFLTVQAAMEYAWATYVAPAGPQASAPFTRPCVFVCAGTYDDGPLVLPPQVCVMGEGFNHSRIMGDWSIDGRWTNYVVVNGASPPIAPGVSVLVPLQTPTQVDLPAGYVIVSWDGAVNVVVNVTAPAGSMVLDVNLPAGLVAGDEGVIINDMRSSWINVGLFGDVNIDFAPVSSNEGKLYGLGVRFGGTGNVTINEKTINPVSNSLTLTACELTGNTTLGGIPTLLEGCVTKGGKLTLNQLVGTGVDNIFESSGGSLGEIHVNSTSALAPPYSCNFGHSVQPGVTLTLNGPFSAINADLSSVPLQSLVALAGATLDQITRTNQPNWSGATVNRPTAVFTGLQFFDTDLGYPIWWNGLIWVDATGTPA